MTSVPADVPRRTPRRVPLTREQRARHERADARSASLPAPRKLTIEEMRADVSARRASKKVLAPAPDVSARRASRNPVLPPRERVADEGTLWTFSSKATRARTAGRSERKILRFPPLRPMYAKSRTDADGNVIRKGASYQGDIWRYLTTWGYRTLNDLDGAGYAPPSHDDLADLFERRVRERAKTYDTYYSNRGHGISFADIETMADAAATSVLRDWSPDWIRKTREWGATGGRKSRPSEPGHADSDADLDALAVLKGMTVAQQAVALNVSPSSIDRMRRALRNRG